MGNGRYNVTSFVEHIPMTSEITRRLFSNVADQRVECRALLRLSLTKGI
jgi:hypothetical protein